MSGELIYFGLTHGTAPLELRERVRVDETSAQDLARELADCTCERMILCTCERFEVYAIGSLASLATIIDRLAARFAVSAGQLLASGRRLRGLDVASHVLRVAAGLESRIVGEPHVLGQWRRSYQRFSQAGQLGPILHGLGRSAITAGRRARAEMNDDGNSPSIVSRVRALLNQSLPGTADPTLAIVGTGRLACDLVGNLARHFPRRIVVSRSPDRARKLAERYGGEGRSVHEMSATLADSDVVIACSNAPEPVINQSHLTVRRQRPLQVIDLGVPRNVDPAVCGSGSVKLTNLDELTAFPVSRVSSCAAAERVVAEELSRFERWLTARQAAPAVTDLVRRFHCPQAMDIRRRNRELHQRIMRLKSEVGT